MAEPDAFDPTHALDGWRPPAPAPASMSDLTLDALPHVGGREAGLLGLDPTHLLDGWRPPALAPLDLELKSLRVGTGTDPAKMARLKARGYEMLDVEDIELVEVSPPPLRVLVEAQAQEMPPAPPLAETDLAPASSSEEAVQAEEAVDVPLADEAVWPLFMAEAQILAEPQPSIEPEPEALRADAALPGEPALPSATAVPVQETRIGSPAAEPERAAMAEGLEVEEVAPAVEAPAASGVVEMPAFEREPVMVAEMPITAELAQVEVESELVEALLADVQVAEPGPEIKPAPVFAADGAASEPEEPVIEPALLVEDAESLVDAAGGAAVEAPESEAPAVMRTPVSEPPMLDLHAFPPPPPAAVEAPVLDFRIAPPPPEPDPGAVIAGIELPKVTPPPVIVEMPELDIAALTPQPPEPDPRLLANWQAGAWTALARQLAGASEELLQTPDGLRVESRAPQWLCAIWPPQTEDAPLGRWPELAALVAAETMADALQQLLAELPEEAPLWPADLEANWDLVAELVLHQDTALRPSEVRALRELAEAERNARLACLSKDYALQGRVARRRA